MNASLFKNTHGRTRAALAALSILGLAWAPFHADAADSPDPSQPDTKLAKPLGRWPNADDLRRLHSVKGFDAARVIRTLGHPSRVEVGEAGQTRWHYPWLAAAVVYIRDGVVEGTFYTAGY